MAKQPYIPWYIGDYVQDCKMLPLNVRGGWVEICLQCWKSDDGSYTGNLEDFSRLMSCNLDEAKQVIDKLIDKNICDHERHEDGSVTIISRKIREMKGLSKTRSKSGKKGAKAKAKAKQTSSKPSANPPAKAQLNPESEIEYEGDNVYKNCMEIYHQFCLKRIGAPAKIDGVQGNAMKALIEYIGKLTSVKEQRQTIQQAWQKVLDNWEKWGAFNQQKLKLSDINSNITNILTDIKNYKPPVKNNENGFPNYWDYKFAMTMNSDGVKLSAYYSHLRALGWVQKTGTHWEKLPGK